ncbi:ALQxL family class IV lanthipeptide [Thermocatellispora tengchongensis]
MGCPLFPGGPAPTKQSLEKAASTPARVIQQGVAAGFRGPAPRKCSSDRKEVILVEIDIMALDTLPAEEHTVVGLYPCFATCLIITCEYQGSTI